MKINGLNQNTPIERASGGTEAAALDDLDEHGGLIEIHCAIGWKLFCHLTT